MKGQADLPRIYKMFALLRSSVAMYLFSKLCTTALASMQPVIMPYLLFRMLSGEVCCLACFLIGGALLLSGDLAGRLAVVPMSQEARGLDAGPRLADRLVGCGDNRTAAIVARIALEEKAHVAVGRDNLPLFPDAVNGAWSVELTVHMTCTMLHLYTVSAVPDDVC